MGQKNKFFKQAHVVYQINEDDEQNRMQSKIFILGSNWCAWGEVKGQISLNFSYHVNFKDFYTKFCVCSHK